MSRCYADPDLGPDMCPGYRHPSRYVRPDPNLPDAVQLPPEPASAPPGTTTRPTRAAERLRAWRIYTGITQVTIAARLGLSRSALHLMEIGAKPVPGEVFAELDGWYREQRRWIR